MTLDQGLAFGIVAVMMGLLGWGRLRYDLVAMLALLASVAVGIVPADEALTGFGDDIVTEASMEYASRQGVAALAEWVIRYENGSGRDSFDWDVTIHGPLARRRA